MPTKSKTTSHKLTKATRLIKRARKILFDHIVDLNGQGREPDPKFQRLHNSLYAFLNQ